MKQLDIKTQVQKTPPMIAVIREDECIGCMKCIQACPFDSIIGASKLMHTVISDVCTGCELCVPPCPVDCIDMITIPEKSEQAKKFFIDQSEKRFEKHNHRLAREKKSEQDIFAHNRPPKERKAEIEAILQRVKRR